MRRHAPAGAAGKRKPVTRYALLRRGNRRLALAVLTEGGPCLGYGGTTIAGVTRRLLRGYNAYRPAPGKGKKKGPKGPKSK